MLICFFSVFDPAVSIAFTVCLQSYCICITRSHCYEHEQAYEISLFFAYSEIREGI